MFTPVFYGFRDYSISLPRRSVVVTSLIDATQSAPYPASLPVTCRVFYPSIDGSPEGATPVLSCGRYPMILFAHGNCVSDPGGHDNEKWFELGATLARSGYVAVFPQLPQIAGNTTEGPHLANDDFDRLQGLISWIRTTWEYSAIVLSEAATGLAGHSWGAALTARLILETQLPIAAHASLSGSYPLALRPVPIPKLLAWGTDDDSLVPVAEWESKLAAPAHVAQLKDGRHWDYLPEGRITCSSNVRGPCELVPYLAADLVTLFFSRYLKPERWAAQSTPTWLPWFNVDPSLTPPPLLLTTRQKFYAGGHLAVWPLLRQSKTCALTLNWKTHAEWQNRNLGHG